MAHSIFGWSYPPGCSGPPEYEEDYFEMHCDCCGAFLPKDPDMMAPKSFIHVEYDSKPVEGAFVEYCRLIGDVEWGAIYEIGYKDQDRCEVRKCRKCGTLNEFVDY